MIKIQLREGLKYFSEDDTDFTIDKEQEKELYEKHLKSYSIKHHLLNGHFRLTEGELVINIKHASVLFSANHPILCYGYEFEKFFEKDLEMDTIKWLQWDELPEGVYEKLTGREIPERNPDGTPNLETSEELETLPCGCEDNEEETEEETPEQEEETEELIPVPEDAEIKEDEDGNMYVEEETFIPVYTYEKIKAMNKKEQIAIIKGYSEEIKPGRLEEDRIQQILELQKNTGEDEKTESKED